MGTIVFGKISNPEDTAQSPKFKIAHTVNYHLLSNDYVFILQIWASCIIQLHPFHRGLLDHIDTSEEHKAITVRYKVPSCSFIDQTWCYNAVWKQILLFLSTFTTLIHRRKVPFNFDSTLSHFENGLDVTVQLNRTEAHTLSGWRKIPMRL